MSGYFVLFILTDRVDFDVTLSKRGLYVLTISARKNDTEKSSRMSYERVVTYRIQALNDGPVEEPIALAPKYTMRGIIPLTHTQRKVGVRGSRTTITWQVPELDMNFMATVKSCSMAQSGLTEKLDARSIVTFRRDNDKIHCDIVIPQRISRHVALILNLFAKRGSDSGFQYLTTYILHTE